MRFLQQGRTLIELIIAMTIGLVIVIGVSSLYISSSGISRTANQVSTTEQAGQLAMLLIGELFEAIRVRRNSRLGLRGAGSDADGRAASPRLYRKYVCRRVPGLRCATDSATRT